MSDDGNPCMTCCALFRVSFYWAEADDVAGQVPATLTEPLTLFYAVWPAPTIARRAVVRCRGRCASVGCAIYASRPSPCREFQMSGEGGLVNAASDRARAHIWPAAAGAGGDYRAAFAPG